MELNANDFISKEIDILELKGDTNQFESFLLFCPSTCFSEFSGNVCLYKALWVRSNCLFIFILSLFPGLATKVSRGSLGGIVE